jgi:hypothetical protein
VAWGRWQGWRCGSWGRASRRRPTVPPPNPPAPHLSKQEWPTELLARPQCAASDEIYLPPAIMGNGSFGQEGTQRVPGASPLELGDGPSSALLPLPFGQHRAGQGHAAGAGRQHVPRLFFPPGGPTTVGSPTVTGDDERASDFFASLQAQQAGGKGPAGTGHAGAGVEPDRVGSTALAALATAGSTGPHEPGPLQVRAPNTSQA